MAKKATLFDLYKTGRSFTVEDGNVKVDLYLQKMNSIQQQKAQRRANAARAVILAIQRSGTPEERAEFESGVVDQFNTREDRVSLLVADKVQSQRAAIEAEVAAQDEWVEDGYLEGLQEAWYDGIGMIWADPDTRTDESIAIYEAIVKYRDQVNEKLKSPEKQAALEFGKMSDQELHDLVLDRQMKAESDMAWLNEYRFQEIYYTCRDADDRSKLYFNSREEIDTLPNEVLSKLMEAVSNLSVDIAEGKD